MSGVFHNSSKFLFLTALSAAMNASAARGQTALSFPDALSIALAQSVEIQRARISESIAASDSKIADYDNDFKLSTNASVADYRPKDGTSGGAPIKERVAGLSLSKTLYDFGRKGAKLDQTALQIRIKALSREEVNDAVTVRLARLFSAAALAQYAEDVAKGLVKVSESRVAQQTTNYRNGLRPEGDLITTQIDLGKALINLQKATADLAQSRLALAAFMGDSPPRALSSTFEFPSPSRSYVDGLSEILARWKQPANSSGHTDKSNKSKSRQRHDLERSSLELDNQLVSLSRRPTLGATIAAQKSGPWGDELKDLYTAQLSFSWDIPWNGQGREERERITLKSQDLDLIERQEEINRDTKISSGVSGFSTTLAQWQLIAAQEQLTSRQLSLVRQRYQSGKASVVEVSTAESDYLNNRMEQARQLTQMISYLLDIADAQGNRDLTSIFVRPDFRQD